MAYLNVDVAVRGPAFKASAAPLLNNLLVDITSQVQSPNQTVKGQTVYDVWDKKISTMGSGSDFTAFQDFAGIPSLDMGFNGGREDPVYHYHSNYDSFAWMAQYGDPGFVYHRTMAQIFGLMTAKLADEPVLSFEAATYASALDSYVGKVEDKLAVALSARSEQQPQDKDEIVALRGAVLGSTATGDPGAFRRRLAKLHEAIAELLVEATKLDAKRAALQEEVAGEIPWWQWPKKFRLAYEVRKVNTKYKYLERDFLYPEGLDGRSWFKHVVFAPGLWTGYAGGKSFFLLLSFSREARFGVELNAIVADYFSFTFRPLNSRLPRSCGEYRCQGLQQCRSLVGHHRGLHQDGDCEHQGWTSWVSDQNKTIEEENGRGDKKGGGKLTWL